MLAAKANKRAGSDKSSDYCNVALVNRQTAAKLRRKVNNDNYKPTGACAVCC